MTTDQEEITELLTRTLPSLISTFHHLESIEKYYHTCFASDGKQLFGLKGFPQGCQVVTHTVDNCRRAIDMFRSGNNIYTDYALTIDGAISVQRVGRLQRAEAPARLRINGVDQGPVVYDLEKRGRSGWRIRATRQLEIEEHHLAYRGVFCAARFPPARSSLNDLQRLIAFREIFTSYGLGSSIRREISQPATHPDARKRRNRLPEEAARVCLTSYLAACADWTFVASEPKSGDGRPDIQVGIGEQRCAVVEIKTDHSYPALCAALDRTQALDSGCEKQLAMYCKDSRVTEGGIVLFVHRRHLRPEYAVQIDGAEIGYVVIIPYGKQAEAGQATKSIKGKANSPSLPSSYQRVPSSSPRTAPSSSSNPGSRRRGA